MKGCCEIKSRLRVLKYRWLFSDFGVLFKTKIDYFKRSRHVFKSKALILTIVVTFNFKISHSLFH